MTLVRSYTGEGYDLVTECGRQKGGQSDTNLTLLRPNAQKTIVQNIHDHPIRQAWKFPIMMGKRRLVDLYAGQSPGPERSDLYAFE
jgi:hypothetical protein